MLERTLQLWKKRQINYVTYRVKTFVVIQQNRYHSPLSL